MFLRASQVKNTIIRYRLFRELPEVGLDGPGIRKPGAKRNLLRLEVGEVFQKRPLAAGARPPDKPVFVRETLGARMIEDPMPTTLRKITRRSS